jgi:peroxiredoxin
LPSAIEQVHRDFRVPPVRVLTINIKESRSKVAAWTKGKGLTVRVLFDPDGDVSQAYRVAATPTVFLVGRDGRMVARAEGTRPWADEKGRRLLKALAEEQNR